MKSVLAHGTYMAAVLAIGTVAFAQNTQTPPPPQTPPPQTQGTHPQGHADPQKMHDDTPHVTVTGCVQREADFRQANNLGRGGAAGTGVGANNEFVIVNVSVATGAHTAHSDRPAGAAAGQHPAGHAQGTGKPPAGNAPTGTDTPPATGGTTGTAAAIGAAAGPMAAFELTGPNEGQAGQFVGKRVEIAGMLKPAEKGPGGVTGGPTAGAPPSGVDVASQDLRLRELEVTSVRATAGDCTVK